MKTRMFILAAAGALTMVMLSSDVSAREGRQRGCRTGEQVQARDGRGEKAGKGEGRFRNGDGRGRGWHRDGTAKRAGNRSRNRKNCIKK